MLPFVFVGVGLLAYFYWQGDSIAAQHAQSSAQAAAAASASQATPAGARPAAPLIIGPQDGTQTTLAQTGASIATYSATAPAFNPPPVAPTMVLPVATLPQSMSTNPTGAPTGPLNSSATAVQSSPIITVPAPPRMTWAPLLFLPPQFNLCLPPATLPWCLSHLPSSRLQLPVLESCRDSRR